MALEGDFHAFQKYASKQLCQHADIPACDASNISHCALRPTDAQLFSSAWHRADAHALTHLYWRLINTVTSSMVLHPLHSDLTFFWLHVTYTVSLAFPARQYSSIDGLPVSVCVCVCGFAAQPEPSGHLVKRGCFMLKGHTHVRLLLKNSAPPSWFTPSANTNQSFPHIIPQASLLVLPFFLFCFSPHLFTR